MVSAGLAKTRLVPQPSESMKNATREIDPEKRFPVACEFARALLNASGKEEQQEITRSGSVLGKVGSTGDRRKAFETWFGALARTHIHGHFQKSKETGLAVALRHLIAASGEILQLTQLAHAADAVRPTVARLVDDLSASGIIHLNKAFRGGHAKEMTQHIYSYVCDTGIVNAARASLDLPALSDDRAWEHAAVACLLLASPEPLCYWQERGHVRIPCVRPRAEGRVDAFVLGPDEASFDPEPYRALRVLHPFGTNYFLLPEKKGADAREAFGLPVRVVTLRDLQSL